MRVSPRAFLPALVVAFLCVGLGAVSAIAETAGITGRVVDRAGDPIPGAVVTISPRGGGEAITLVADEAGQFQSPRLDAGSFVVEAKLPSAEQAARVEVVVLQGEIVAVELKIDLDMLHERVSVIASVPRNSVETREIRESFARDAGESLSRVDGVAMIRKGAIANDVVVRGQKGENLSVRIDGMRIHGACPNKMDPPVFHIDFAEIERIDVNKGPLDVTVPGALGGGINIVTRRPDVGLHGGAQVGVGSFGYFAPAAAGAFADSTWSIKAGVSMREQDPYEDGDGLLLTERANYTTGAMNEQAFDISTKWAGLTVTPAPGHLIEAQATRQNSNLVLYPYLQMDAEYDDADRFRVAYTAERRSGAIDRISAAVSYADVDHWMTDRLRTSNAGRPKGYSMATLASASVAEAQVSLALGRWMVGAEGYQRNWDAQNEMFMAALGAYGLQAALPDVDTQSFGVYATYTRPLGATTNLKIGGRIDQAKTEADPAVANTNLYYAYHGVRETNRSDTLPGASVALTVRPGGAWEFFAGAGIATRVPSAEERYYALKRGSGSDWVGDPTLEPPQNTQFDAGAAFHGTRLSADVSLHHGWISDFITIYDQVRVHEAPGVSNTQAKSYANVSARIWGGEATVTYVATRRLLFSAGASYTRGEQDAEPERGIFATDLPEMPPFRGRLAARYDAGGWFGEVEGVFADAQDHINTDLLEIPTPGYGVANVRAGVTLGLLSLIVGVDNAFDRAYREHLSYARDPFRSGYLVYSPGRSITASILVRR